MLNRSSLAATTGAVVIVSVAAFFGARALTAALTNNPQNERSGPQITGIVATPVPPPPEWPRGKPDDPSEEGSGAEANDNSTDIGEDEYEGPSEGETNESSPEPPPEEPPVPNPEPKEQGGSPKGGFIEEGSVGG